MRRKKVNIENLSSLLTTLIPRIEETTKHQIHSLFTLGLSVMFILTPLTGTVAAGGSISYQISKNVIAVNGTPVGGIPGGNVTAAGDIITYQINVNNTGDNITNVTISDPMLGINNVTNLSNGENWNYTGNYTVTQADIDSNGNSTGSIINNVTVVCDQNRTATNASVTTGITSCTIVKTVTDVAGQGPAGNVTAAGDVIGYQINVNNTAEMDLTNVTVSDPMLGINNVTNLSQGESWNYTGNYTVTQEDINNNGTVGNGFINNNVIVDCDQLGPKNASVSVPLIRNPNYSIFKSVIDPDPTGDCIINKAGDEVPYRIVVNNEGNVNLTNVTVNDTLISSLLLSDPSGDDNGDNVLNPGETWIYNAVYTLTPGDVENGSVNNTATVVCDQLPEKSSNISTPVVQNADLSIYKAVTGIDEAGDHLINHPGDVINYQVAVKNNGNMDLTNVTVSDPMITLTKSSGDHNDPGVLNPGELWVYTGDYTVTQSDIDTNGNGTGFITNTATVSCKELSDESSSIQLPIVTVVNTQTDTNNGSDNTPANGSESKSETTNEQPATGSNGGGSSGGGGGGSIGTATVVSSNSGSTANTSATPSVTQTETNTPNVEPSSTPANVQTPEPTATSTPAKESKKTPGFEIISGVTALLGAVYLYRRR